MSLLSFGSNIQALRAQRYLDGATSEVSTSYTRLSSGLRINNASDDAAGLAVADSLRVQARLQTTAIRNANDGVSAINIISSTLRNQLSITTRLSELAEQASNGTFSTTQRGSLNDEYQALIQEYGRLGESTSFNDLKLLLNRTRGGVGSFSLQIGFDGSIDSILSVTTTDTGRISGDVDLSTLASSGLTGTQSLETLRNHYRGGMVEYVNASGQKEAVAITYAGAGFGFTYNRFTKQSDGSYLASTPNLGTFDTTTGQLTTVTAGTLESITGVNFSAFRFVDSTGTRAPSASGTTNLNFTGVSGATGALVALDATRLKISELSNILGQFGALESRLDAAKNVLFASKESTLNAESRIRDVDVASETATLVASQIKQQSAVSVLKQANSQPALLINLLSNI